MAETLQRKERSAHATQIQLLEVEQRYRIRRDQRAAYIDLWLHVRSAGGKRKMHYRIVVQWRQLAGWAADDPVPFYFSAQLIPELTTRHEEIPGSVPSRQMGPQVQTHRVLRHSLLTTMVVARGVHLEMALKDANGIDEEELYQCLFERLVYRVQTLDVIPQGGEPLDTSLLFGAYNHRDLVQPVLEGCDLLVQNIPNGTRFVCGLTNQVLQVTVNPMDGASGFSYDIPYPPTIRRHGKLFLNNLLRLRIWGNVELKQRSIEVLKADDLRFYSIQPVASLKDLSFERGRFQDHVRVSDYAVFNRWSVDYGNKSIQIYDLNSDILAKLAFDVAIGAIPIVGDLVDIGDFLLAITTDHDKYGDKVDTTGKVLMGAGALLPFVSAAALRRFAGH